MPNLLVTEEQRIKHAQKSREWRAAKKVEDPKAYQARVQAWNKTYRTRHLEEYRAARRQQGKQRTRELNPYYARTLLTSTTRHAGLISAERRDYPPELVDAWADSIKAGRLFVTMAKKLNQPKGLQ